ncbi:MAG: heavy-metal-associated domain-containing protein, partial [Deltaproteobacteria bacterium]|nr:heavy-metal-associated domain-containing protein [Deltaproteobacteria bacterium]
MADQKVTLPITGMTCANCAINIERGVKKLEGVKIANANFAAEQAAVSFDPKLVDVRDIVEKIKSSGYGVVSAKVELPITGMTCVNCAANIERALNKKTSGVVSASVNFASERATIEYIPEIST